MAELLESSLNIDYYGIISTLSKEIGIASIIDKRLGVHHNQKVTTGQSIDAILLNMLAIFMRPLYLNSEFLNDKPVDRLIHPDLKAEYFNDDVLGRGLDRLYKYGLEEIFLEISSDVFLNYPQFVSPYLHGDTTSMAVHGEYNTKNDDTGIEITYGYSKDHRPDLKQFVVSMVTSNRLPVFISTLSGNTSDKKHFRQLIREYGRQMQAGFKQQTTFIFDAAFYVSKTIKACGTETKWISRVSEKITEAKNLVENLAEKQFEETELKGYKIYEIRQSYADVEQRWIVVSSEKAYTRESKTFEKIIAKERASVDNDIWHLSNELFKSKSHACEAAKKIIKSWKYHEVDGDLDDLDSINDSINDSIKFIIKEKKKNGGRGRPKIGEQMLNFYQIKLKAKKSKAKISKKLATKGRFIVATNDLSEDFIAVDVLKAYKSQHNVERGFRFLKDPMFFVDSVYIKNQSRIMAMVMIMGLALLIYSLAEMKLRAAFETHNEVFLDKYRKQTNKPTIRRVLQTWSGIHIRYLQYAGKMIDEKVLNLKEENLQVLRLLGPTYQQVYANKKAKGELIWQE